MSQRYTRKDAEHAFERLLAMTGKRKATSWNDVGGWTLDYAPIYGGYNVEEISSPSGGVSQPFGMQRRTAREFCDTVRFLADALRAMDK